MADDADDAMGRRPDQWPELRRGCALIVHPAGELRQQRHAQARPNQPAHGRQPLRLKGDSRLEAGRFTGAARDRAQLAKARAQEDEVLVREVSQLDLAAARQAVVWW